MRNSISRVPGMFKPQSVKGKFAALVIGATLVSCVTVAALSYVAGRSGLIEASELRLQSVATSQVKDLTNFDARLEQMLGELSQNSAIGEASDTINNVMDLEGDDIRAVFQPKDSTPEQRAEISGIGTKLLYGVQHAAIHGTISSAWKNTGVSDIYVVSAGKKVVYSVTKGDAFLHKIGDPETANLQPLVEQALSGTPEAVYKSGFIPRADGSMATYLARPLAVNVWGDLQVKGVIIIEIGADKLARFANIGEGENALDAAFILSSDGGLRAGITGGAEGSTIPDVLLQAAAANEAGSKQAASDAGELFYSYLPVSIAGQGHLLVVGQAQSKVLAAANQLAMLAGLATIAVLVFMGIIGYVVAGRLTNPLTSLADLMNRLNDGDKSIEVNDTDRKDEVGTMARALESFRQNAVEKDRIETEAAENDERAEAERHAREAEKARTEEELATAVRALGDALKALSSGRLNVRIETTFAPALDQLRIDFNDSVAALEDTIRAIGASVETIHADSGNLREASQSLASRTERQAASLEEAAASLAEMTTLLNGTLERCETADRVTGVTLDGALSSGQVVKEAITAMERIQHSSGEIRKIIDVIDQIAFQTNLLALNAGVEAARAGEAGKGFAVVAQEVRELAQRSSEAAKNINEIILNSGAEVENGVSLVLKTGESLGKIEQNVHEISDHISAIVEASRDQSGRLGEINSSVNALDQVTQQNAAMVEETTASAHGLDHEANNLSNQIGHFVVSGAASGSMSKVA